MVKQTKFPFESETMGKKQKKLGVGSNSRSDEMLELVKLQLVQRQDQDKRNHVEAEEQRLNQQQLIQQQQLMMLMIANMSAPSSGITNVASHNLSIAHLLQTGSTSNAPGNGETESPAVNSHSPLSSKSSASKFSVRPEIPPRNPGVEEVDLISDLNDKTPTPQKKFII